MKSLVQDAGFEVKKFHSYVYDGANPPDYMLTIVDRGADALLNNLRGDLPAKLGLDYKSMSAVNAKLVCVHLSAYGRNNERASWPTN